MENKVSVVIPVYNSENSILKTLESLLKQTYTNFQVIIIDDGSIDNTKLVIENYLSVDHRFRYYYQDNRGVSVARNKGIDFSTSKYICFLDSDDYYEISFLKKMVNKIDKESADICYCGYYRVSPDKKSKVLTKFKSNNVLIDYILENVKVHTTGWIVNKELLLNNGIRFKTDVSWGEDFEFFCEVLSKSKKITYVNEYLTNYRVGFESDRLSNFSLDKIDKDFESINRVLNNINVDDNIRSALIDYRLKALIVYKLLLAINKNYDLTVVKKYFQKYQKYILNPNKIWSLRGIKLYNSRRKLINKINKIK